MLKLKIHPYTKAVEPDEWTNGQTNRRTDRQVDKPTDTGRQAVRLAGKHIGRLEAI